MCFTGITPMARISGNCARHRSRRRAYSARWSWEFVRGEWLKCKSLSRMPTGPVGSLPRSRATIIKSKKKKLSQFYLLYFFSLTKKQKKNKSSQNLCILKGVNAAETKNEHVYIHWQAVVCLALRWEQIRFKLGTINQPHAVIIEFVTLAEESSVSISQLRLVDCFPGKMVGGERTCSKSQKLERVIALANDFALSRLIKKIK